MGRSAMRLWTPRPFTNPPGGAILSGMIGNSIPEEEGEPSLVFDFDSTLITVEGADELFARTLAEAPDREERVSRFQKITDRGMAGEISYEESLRARMALLAATRAEVAEVGRALVDHLTPSVLDARGRLARQAHRIWIISGGFEELILPVVEALELDPERVRAHRLQWSDSGRVAGVDPTTALARGGKPQAVREARIPRPLWVIGDGATDLELRTLDMADRFFAFVENRRRREVVEGADAVLHSLMELPTLD